MLWFTYVKFTLTENSNDLTRSASVNIANGTARNRPRYRTRSSAGFCPICSCPAGRSSLRPRSRYWSASVRTTTGRTTYRWRRSDEWSCSERDYRRRSSFVPRLIHWPRLGDPGGGGIRVAAHRCSKTETETVLLSIGELWCIISVMLHHALFF